MKKYYLVIIALAVGLSIFFTYDGIKASPNIKVSCYAKDSVSEITISVVGDIMCHSTQYLAAQVSRDSFDFAPAFEGIKPIIKNSDFTIGNLETVFGGKEKGYSGYPMFNSPDAYLQAIKAAGFNYLSTANNHSLDRGEFGLLRTIQQLIKNNINYAGTYSSPKDADSIRIFNVKGIKISILPYTYGTNGNPIPKGKGFLISLIDKERIKNDIAKARAKGADLVIVHFHYGEEYTLFPNSAEKELVKKTIEFGADIIIGGHPHVLQPVDYFTPVNKNFDKGFIAYSMGNFISGQTKSHTDEGKIILLKIKKDFIRNRISLMEEKEINTRVIKDNKTGMRYIKVL
ncbi:MAG: CapA family protein [Bacteroidota bacterium]|nr:CapA family protein [Bacteroidota bacterium]